MNSAAPLCTPSKTSFIGAFTQQPISTNIFKINIKDNVNATNSFISQQSKRHVDEKNIQETVIKKFSYEKILEMSRDIKTGLFLTTSTSKKNLQCSLFLPNLSYKMPVSVNLSDLQYPITLLFIAYHCLDVKHSNKFLQVIDDFLNESATTSDKTGIQQWVERLKYQHRELQ
ncbi:unnamed protein product [Didymodactylos carnosus]|uniref:Uncharacterized protein n=1 Tax=Didymodactylos carnosus TaxID=1234261 RepID=A0A815TNN7_9BILA|nr:unnamed protein product [Didymodactylos carnosus]CAF1507574.1 unnamed protein product [Didymodactylos carnosus]CAF4273685.1 unnamed protein product [Didymodactylos carnosus]CAF4368687.1 unnamed protein product [Didymodactylos carnosus]